MGDLGMGCRQRSTSEGKQASSKDVLHSTMDMVNARCQLEQDQAAGVQLATACSTLSELSLACLERSSFSERKWCRRLRADEKAHAHILFLCFLWVRVARP